MRKNILQTVQTDAEFLLGRIVETLVCKFECPVEVNSGRGDARVLCAGRAAVVMAVDIADFTRRAGDPGLGAVMGIVIVRVVYIDVITFSCNSAGLIVGKAEADGNIIGCRNPQSSGEPDRYFPCEGLCPMHTGVLYGAEYRNSAPLWKYRRGSL